MSTNVQVNKKIIGEKSCKTEKHKVKYSKVEKQTAKDVNNIC